MRNLRQVFWISPDLPRGCHAEFAATGILGYFMGRWEDRWAQFIQSQVRADWELMEACSDMELRMAHNPWTTDLLTDLSVLPCFIPRGYE